MSNDVVTMSPNDVIAEYARKVLELKSALSCLEEDNNGLQEKVKELEGLLKKQTLDSVPKAVIAKMMVGSFRNGDIPVPEKIVQESGGLLTISVNHDDILSFSDSVRVVVTFSSHKSGDYKLSFSLEAVPEIVNGNTRAHYYPGFVLKYSNPDPKKQKIPKPKPVKKALVSESLSTECTGNPS